VLTTRLLTAAIGIPFVAGAMWLGGGVLAGLVALAIFVAVLEVSMIRGTQRTLEGIAPCLLAALLPIAALADDTAWLMGAIVLAIMLPGAIFAFTQDPKTSLENWLWGVATALYVGLLASHFVLLRDAEDGRAWLFVSVLTVWATDTGAYAVGRTIGKHKMSPVVSPGKTVEGAIGSFVTGFISIFVLCEAFGLDIDTVHKVVLGLVLPPIILIGDLAESAIKRGLGVKDSGFLVPGHGGILDRLDSLLFAIPVVFYYLVLVIQR
jgi:phosphatidate cytidylyltransferase